MPEENKLMIGDKKYVYVGKENRISRMTYNLQGFKAVKAIYENDAQTGLLALYDGNDTIIYSLGENYYGRTERTRLFEKRNRM